MNGTDAGWSVELAAAVRSSAVGGRPLNGRRTGAPVVGAGGRDEGFETAVVGCCEGTTGFLGSAKSARAPGTALADPFGAAALEVEGADEAEAETADLVDDGAAAPRDALASFFAGPDDDAVGRAVEDAPVLEVRSPATRVDGAAPGTLGATPSRRAAFGRFSLGAVVGRGPAVVFTVMSALIGSQVVFSAANRGASTGQRPRPSEKVRAVVWARPARGRDGRTRNERLTLLLERRLVLL